jgi:succinyl-CoA synthetase beta subunit/malate-CoA ligase subunit beta
MFGRKLVTHQTGPEGKGVYRVYVEAATPLTARSIWASCSTAPRSGS